MSMGGKTTSTTEIPAFIEDALKENLARAQAQQKIGYMPYYGPDVAAMTPMQEGAMQNTANMARSYGMIAPQAPWAGMPQAQTYDGGMKAYSSGNLFDQALSSLQQRRPGQYQAYTDMFINPQTGADSMFDQNRVSDALVGAGVDPSLAANVASGDSTAQAQLTGLLNSDYNLALKVAQATRGIADAGVLGAIAAPLAFVANKAATSYIADTPYASTYQGRTSSPDISYSSERDKSATTGYNFNLD